MIYVHIPFCRSFCTYCDFYSEVAAKCRRKEDENQQQALFESFAGAIGREIKFRAEEFSSEVNTLYIGGGTPSVLPLTVYTSLMESLAAVGIKAPFEEFTFELNPEDVVEKGEEYIRGLMDLGVNRISMGIQSFDDGILHWMNRRHNAETAIKAYAILSEAGISNISIDLIFGLPQLSDEKWKESLKKALEIAPDCLPPKHISAYQLSVEPGSALAKLVDRGLWTEASDELCARQYEILCETLRDAGYEHYEISNFAQPGFEAVHNSAYWAHVPYVGLGPGAHSFILSPQSAVSRRTWNKADLEAYISDPCGLREGEELDEEQLKLEHIMLALRTSKGIPENLLRDFCDEKSLAVALASANLKQQKGYVRIPENRFFLSDRIISEII